MLQVALSLKQARLCHRSPIIRLSQAPDQALSLMCHIQAYLEFTAPLFASRPLFITTTPLHKAAACITLKQWFDKVLEGVGVDVSLGSVHAAVASNALALGVSENAIMESADWASVCTLFANYVHFLPTSTLSAITSSSVQDAVLSWQNVHLF